MEQETRRLRRFPGQPQPSDKPSAEDCEDRLAATPLHGNVHTDDLAIVEVDGDLWVARRHAATDSGLRAQAVAILKDRRRRLAAQLAAVEADLAALEGRP